MRLSVDEIYVMHSEICKTLANPKRLEILIALQAGEVSVADLVKQLRLPKANVSQHLGVLRARGVVKTRRDGLTVYYRIASPKIIRACNLMREVLMEQVQERAQLTRKWNQAHRSSGRPALQPL